VVAACKCVPAGGEPPFQFGGVPINEALAENPHLKFKRLPSYSPQLNPIERVWKVLRRRATHNRLFDALAALDHYVLGEDDDDLVGGDNVAGGHDGKDTMDGGTGDTDAGYHYGQGSERR
jgi:hypothetical protein